MLFLVSFLLFLAAAFTALLLMVDTVYAKSDADRRLDHAGGQHWGPADVLVEEPVAGRSLLPAVVRARMWWVLAATSVLGLGLLFLAT